jgi:hypothetical protein
MKKLAKEDFESLDSHSALQKYRKKDDGSIYSAKILMVSENYNPESHPVIMTLEKLASIKHSALPQCFGYFLRKNQGFDEVVVLLEHCESTLADYLQKNEFSSLDLKRFLQEIIEAVIFIDRNANITPIYLTPYNILVVEDSTGKKRFKLFGFLPDYEESVIPLEYLRWTSPEVFEKQKFKKIHINVNTEKALFYSIGIIFIYCAVNQHLITEGRELYPSNEFTLKNSSREESSVKECFQRLKTLPDWKYFEQVLSKILAYNPQTRPDFRIWNLSSEGSISGANPILTQNKKGSTKKSKQEVRHDQIPLEVNQPKSLSTKKKHQCCNIF